MTDVLRESVQRLRAESSRETAAGNERRSVKAIQQRMQTQETAGKSPDILDIATHTSPVPISKPKRVPVVQLAPNELNDESRDTSPTFDGSVAPEVIDLVAPASLSRVAPQRETNGRSRATTRENSNYRPHERSAPERPTVSQVTSPTAAGIDLAGIVEMVRDELRPMLEDLGERLARTVRSEGNSRQFRVRANQLD